MNPDYGPGRYDGRFDNSEFFKDNVGAKLRSFLNKKAREARAKA